MSELLDKIAKEISKSGFPLEIYCRNRIERAGWSAQGPHYVEAGERLQELDVVGSKQYHIKSPDVTVFATAHISCKKSKSNHWVFFKEQDLSANRRVQGLFLDDRELVVDNLGDFPTKDVVMSRSYCMAFDSPKNQIYEGMQEALASYRFFRNFYGRHRVERRPSFNIVDIDVLTVVFDGQLFAAEVGEDLSIKVSEVKHVVHHHHEVQWPRHDYFTFEIVQKDFLDTYLAGLNKDMDRFVKRLKKRLSK